MGVTDYVSIAITLCEKALAAVKWAKEKYDAKSFSAEEKAILTAAAQQGTIQIIKCNSMLSVFVVCHNFSSETDNSVAARYLDAFIQLCDKGLITHHGDEMFCLNGKGFEIARNLPPQPPFIEHKMDDE